MKIETKYEVGEMVWCIQKSTGKPKRREIKEIDILAYNNNGDKLYYNIYYIFDYFDDRNNSKFIEEDVYKTKEELLNWLSQWS